MNENTLDKMKKMKFYGMFRAFKTSLESDHQQDYTSDTN